jgi:small subunit ribosomal protein S4
MGRYLGPRCRLMRREGVNLDLKKKWTLERRDTPPGQHGAKKTKLSNYGLQLREKQKTKRFYCVLEKQFRNYFIKAASTKGVTGHILLQLLERRIDNVVYQMGFALTRSQGRQIVSHGLVLLNGKKIDIPSIQVKPGDTVEFNAKPATAKLVQGILEKNDGWAAPAWLEVDSKKLIGKVVRLPLREDIKAPVNEQLIVELYSR